VSFDLDVFLTSESFPASDFLTLLADFGDTTERDQDRFGRHWCTQIGSSAIFCSVRELIGDHLFGFEHGYKWDVSISANSGCPPRARWAQFALPYRWLGLIPESTAYDPQSGVFFDAPDSFREFAQNTLPRWPKLSRQLRKLELMDLDGRPRF